jgi:hypothetical protein
MRKTIISVAATMTLAVSGAAVAGDIYKWVDAEGNVHYGDRPVAPQSERMDIESRPTTAASVEAQTSALAASNDRRAEARTAADEDAAAAAELRAEAEQRAAKCAASRATMQRFVQSRRLYREDEAGERQYLDEAEMQAARQRVENDINEYCNNS